MNGSEEIVSFLDGVSQMLPRCRCGAYTWDVEQSDGSSFDSGELEKLPGGTMIRVHARCDSCDSVLAMDVEKAR